MLDPGEVINLSNSGVESGHNDTVEFSFEQKLVLLAAGATGQLWNTGVVMVVVVQGVLLNFIALTSSSLTSQILTRFYGGGLT